MLIEKGRIYHPNDYYTKVYELSDNAYKTIQRFTKELDSKNITELHSQVPPALQENTELDRETIQKAQQQLKTLNETT